MGSIEKNAGVGEEGGGGYEWVFLGIGGIGVRGGGRR